MSSQLLIQLVRQQLEEDLLERVREAEKAYRNAPVERGRAPLDRYGRLLGIFTDLVVSVHPSRHLMLNTLLATAIDIMGADKGTIQVSDASPGSLRIEAQRGFDRSFLDFFAKGYDGATACGVAFQTSQRVIVEDITSSPIFVGTPCLQMMLDAGLRAVQSTPLLGRNGHVIGILSTHYSRAVHLSARDLSMLDRVSSQAALFIEAYSGH